MYASPRKLHSLNFSRASSGNGYGLHWDSPFMSLGRTELAFTLLLSDPEDFEGGELFLNFSPSIKIKLKAGQVIIYPFNVLNEVSEVLSGEMIVSIGWD